MLQEASRRVPRGLQEAKTLQEASSELFSTHWDIILDPLGLILASSWGRKINDQVSLIRGWRQMGLSPLNPATELQRRLCRGVSVANGCEDITWLITSANRFS